MGNKAMKTKLTNMLRRKERKKWKRIDMQSYIEVDKEDLYALKIKCKGLRTTVGKTNKEM